jgi:Na(+)-translocating NADH:ubiquinone oxidoreductase A subunit
VDFTGGYNVALQGRPSDQVDVLAEPECLHLPLQSRRFQFDRVAVTEGQEVAPGHVLARDRGNYSVPLLAPRAGTVRLDAVDGHVTLEDVAKVPEEPYHPDQDLDHIRPDLGSAGMKRHKLVELGAWQFLADAYTGELPDPFGVPQAVVVSTLDLEPFLARGDVQLHSRLASLTRGLEHVQSLLEYQPIYLVVPDIESEFAARVRETLRGYAFLRLIEIPYCYPCDHPAVLARALGLSRHDAEPVWALGVAGALAIDRALTLARPSTVRIVAIGGPAAEAPRHLRAMPGYPLADILGNSLASGGVRVLNGGALTGTALAEEQRGLDVECSGLTLLPEHTEREFLGFLRPGRDRQSYSRCFFSALGKPFAERLTTALRGERRACVACGYCEEVCPVAIMPHLIHKLLYQDALEEAERAGIDRCVACGLCSFVCPSKIELRQQMEEGQETVREELHPETEPPSDTGEAEEEEAPAST